LGIEWACVDQGLLQRAFGAESTRSVAKGLVMAGIITTPFALLWILPGLAARILFPDLANADSAVPLLITRLIPNLVLGLVVVGLLSSQLSTISGNLNGVATIFASDIYENLINRKATDKDVLKIARIITLITGIGMILFAYWVPILGGAVNAYLTIIAIMDMPLFVIAVVYGLLWKRINWQGAVGGYIAGAISGIIGQFIYGLNFNVTTFITAGTTLLITPIISLLTKEESNEQIEAIWYARRTSEEEITNNNVYNILPKTAKGKLSMIIFTSGLVMFLVGVFMGSIGSSAASYIAVSGMVIYFIGGLFRTYTN
jgi:SSS family solute:Na+ symporter